MTSAITTSRFLFPEDRTTFVYGRPGDPIRTPPRTAIKLFVDEAGTIPADVQTTTGMEIAYSTVYTGDDSLLPEFLGPPGFVPRLWARVVGGTAQTYPLMAQYSDRLANLPMLVTGNGPPSPEVGAVGSFYIDVDTPTGPNDPSDPKLYGPRTVSGWPAEGVSLRGAEGPPGSVRIWYQNAPATEWRIEHDLPYTPSVTLIDSAGDEFEADVSYPMNEPQVVIARCGAPESGKALLK